METSIALLVASLIALMAIVIAKAVQKKNAKNHWKAYLLASPGERNKVVWAGKPPELAHRAARFVEMYEDTWQLVVQLWPDAAVRLAQFNRPRAFAECEAVLAPLTDIADPVDRFVDSYILMAMITFDERLHARLKGATAEDLDLDTAAKDYVRDLYGESTPAVDFGIAGKLMQARWQHVLR